jgi:hypothetical protein
VTSDTWRPACRPLFDLIPRMARSESLVDFPGAAEDSGALTLVTLHFDDQFPAFREVDGLSDTAFRLHVTAFFWCRINRTDGLIRLEDLDLVCARVRASERFAAECVRRGAWHDARNDCGSEHCLGSAGADGWVLHDFLKDNQSAAEMAAEEAGKSAGGKHGNHRRWHEKRKIKVPECEFCEVPETAEIRPRKPPPKRTSHNRSHTDRICDDDATPRSRSDFDFDFDQSARSQISQSGVSDARAREDDPPPGTPGFRLQVMAEFAVATRTEIDEAAADAIAADVLGDAADPVVRPLPYVLAAVRNERDPYRRWLAKRVVTAPRTTVLPAWCGRCDEIDRTREDDQGRVLRCPECYGRAPAWEAS